MEDNLNQEERSLFKLIQYFQKNRQKLIDANLMDEPMQQLIDAGEKLMEQITAHADNRAAVMENHALLETMVRDNAKCPQCASAEHLKVIGTDTNEKGWVSNKYKCRKCNITFVWNAPNNPWHMIPYVEEFIANFETKLADSGMDETARGATEQTLSQMRANIGKLKPVVESSDKQLEEMRARDKEMINLVGQVKKHLMIMKIRLDD